MRTPSRQIKAIQNLQFVALNINGHKIDAMWSASLDENLVECSDRNVHDALRFETLEFEIFEFKRRVAVA